MKLLIAGDLHLSEKRPEHRIDGYAETVINKFLYILNCAEKEADLILFPGDFFDSPNPSYSFYTKVVSCVGCFATPIIIVFGQHDLRFRNPDNTALKALAKSFPNRIFLLENNNQQLFHSQVMIYGAGFNEEVPEPDKERFDVLLTHRMIIDEKLWDDQTDYSWGNHFLRKHKFDLIISGDNHKNFSCLHGERMLFNCGSMMRSSITQMEHHPSIVLLDTGTMLFNTIPIPIQPPEEVFEMERVMKEKERDEKITAFISGLSDQKEIGLSFESNLNAHFRENKTKQEIIDIIEECKNE